ncbi:hypothetical protein [Mycolicibacterium sp.]|uniref:hypothetical protein n=1 Tax=Mycolicibacterium sp. TaxID=2320850 RepID=UPI00355EA10C
MTDIAPGRAALAVTVFGIPAEISVLHCQHSYWLQFGTFCAALQRGHFTARKPGGAFSSEGNTATKITPKKPMRRPIRNQPSALRPLEFAMTAQTIPQMNQSANSASIGSYPF